jgi:hypothetical protein
MLTKDNQLVAKLNELQRTAHHRAERLYLSAVKHVYSIIETSLPETATTVFCKKVEIIVGSRELKLMQLAVVRECKGTIARRTDENGTILTLENRADTRFPPVREAIMYETAFGRIVAVKAMIGSYPETTLAVTEQLNNHIKAQRLRIVIIMKEGRETVAVVTIQSVIGSNPDKALAILTNG